jgi:hypothetical protein
MVTDSFSVSLLFLYFPFIWCQNPGENFEWGECPSQATVIPWQSSYDQWYTPMGSLIQGLYRCTRAKRCLRPQEGHSQCPTPSPNCLTSVQNSLSLPSLPPHYLLYDAITIILSAKPPHHTDSSFGHRVRSNCPFCWTRTQKLLLVGFFYLIATLLWGLTFWSYISP